ncbi:hypothetical protein D3C84_415730 [compost metagenome]
MQHDLDLIQLDAELGIEGFDDFRQGLLEVAIVVDAVDQGDGDQPVGIGHGGQVELPEQVALQAFADRGARGEVPLVVVIARQAAGAGLVDVFPGGVDGQFAGDAFVPFAVFQGFGIGLDAGLLEARFLAAGVGQLVSLGHRVGVVEIFAILLPFEHGIGLQGLLDLLLQIQGGQLE